MNVKIDHAFLIARLVTRFMPAIRAIAAALAKGSEGGKAVTPDERDKILASLISIAEDELGAGG